jgi:protocatechuate 3,4-dioxygenase beta subunit
MTIQFSEGETKQLNVELTPIPPVPASLQGQVTDAETGLPISGVAVALAGPIAVGVLTGTDGYYSIGNIPPGSYTVRFSHPDYETVEY